MSEIPCQYPDCDYIATNASEAIALAMFQSHLLSHQRPAASSSSSQKLPPIERPEILQDVSDEDWETFLAQWNHFKRCTDIPPDRIPDHLYMCCEKSLARLIIREDPDIIAKGEEELKKAIKRLAVIKIANSVRRTNLLTVKQKPGEPIREFFANVKASAKTCKFEVQCSHQCCNNRSKIDYTSSVVKDVLIAGIADVDIRKEILSIPDLDEKTDKDLVDVIEAKEIAMKAWNNTPVLGTAGISHYRRDTKLDSASDSLKEKLALMGKCGTCNKEMSIHKKFPSGKINKKPFKLCPKCWKDNSQSKNNASTRTGTSETAEISGFFIGAIEEGQQGDANHQLTANAIDMDHHIFTEEGWRRALTPSHPKLRLRVSTSKEDYSRFGVPFPKIHPKHIDVVVDSGAQSCLWSQEEFVLSGFSMSDLIPVRNSLKAANKAPINIVGAILLRISGKSGEGENKEAAVMTYVSPDAQHFYLSKEAMVQLDIIDEDFPQVGASIKLKKVIRQQHVSGASFPDGESIGDGSSLPLEGTCTCKKRELPPPKPESLPFPCTPENNTKMKNWLLERYSSSTFNKCPHQMLPTMEGPPIKIHVSPDAKPVAFRKPAPVPLHWQEQVKDELFRDVALGVLERVPHGEPTSWCFRMVISRKDDGGPRRTVDLSPLNRFCEREAHASRSPFVLARSVPGGSFKSVFDAWNGYHSVPIREEDRHLTTFVTPWGLFRYKRAPQGFVSSGDGYNRRFDDIASHITRLERCVDDNLIHDNVLEDHWWRAIDFIELCGKAGVVLNPEKFQFAEMDVKFAGFRITENSVEPLPKYLDAIRGFPTPTNITDIRSWFGLVNQVSHYAQLRDLMEPFRQFLSPKVKFTWNNELDAVFNESKTRIIDAIKEGVRIFDVTRRTCLRTDWSEKGIGYYLSQKHCECESRTHGCCPDGWKVTLAGSRFLTSTEKNYAAIEGEALAAAWSLEQTRFFTMGCNDLLVITDHQPLVKILGDRRLDEIDNPRLFRLKRRTLMWKFDIEYQRGEKNQFADAMSRYPNSYAEQASLSMMNEGDFEEPIFISGISSETESFFAVTWDRIRSASHKDPEITLLNECITNGFPESKKEMPGQICEFWEVRNSLYVSEGVVLYKDRIVVPKVLRKRVIENLHSAHQGVSTMYSRAQQLVYWPGMVTDIDNARNECRTCHRNAPSQSRLPPTVSELPKTPFQKIYSDFFELFGQHYLIVGDRLSGWTEVLKIKPGTSSSGSKGLCQALRQIFVTFGVAEEISSDGGPEFISHETDDFFKRWGTEHRLSSAYYPQSNGRAEVAVKITKRLLEDNMDKNGNLNTDEFVRALLQHRNTPDKDCKLSPAEILFGRTLRDSMPQLNKNVMVFESDQIHSQWHQAWSAKEEAIRSRLVRYCEEFGDKSKELPPLREGDNVFVQNQDKSIARPTKWDRQGRIIAAKDNDQYIVKIDGSGRLTLRNRRFLKKFQLRSDVVPLEPVIPRSAAPRSTTYEDDLMNQEETNGSDEFIGRIDEPDSSPVPDLSPPDSSSPVSVTAPVVPSQGSSPVLALRKSTRTREQRKLYDASTGGYAEPASK